MLRRLPLHVPTLLAVMACWLSGSLARAIGPERITFPDGAQVPIDLRADDVATWTEGNERVIALGRNAVIRQGSTKIQSEWAIVWVPLQDAARSGPERITIYAAVGVAIDQDGKRTEHSAILGEMTTRGGLEIKGRRVEKKSVAHTAPYQQAMEARQGKATGTPVPAVLSPLPTAEPMAPALVEPVQFTQPRPAPPAVQLEPTPRPTAPPPQASGGPTTLEPPTFETPIVPLPEVNTRILRIAPRTSMPNNAKYMNLPNGEQIGLVTGGIKLLAFFTRGGNTVLDIEADQLVIWQSGGNTRDIVEAMRDRDGMVSTGDRHIEIYLSGNVVIRYGNDRERKGPDGSPLEDKVFRAEQIYYDVSKNKAIAINADLEFQRPGIGERAHLKADEVWQLSLQEWQAKNSSLNASKLPADPGLELTMAEVTILERKALPRTTIFGLPFRDRETGQELLENERTFIARNAKTRVADVPVLYFPYLEGDANDPFGPLAGVGFRQDRVFGTQFYTTWDILELVGVRALPGEKWNLQLDYLSERGPAAGTVYQRTGSSMFGVPTAFESVFKAYGVYDEGTDQLGGPRDLNFVPTQMRGRVFFRHVQQYENWYLQSQISYLSDTNFLEQFYKYEFDQGPNNETFLDLKYQEGIGAGKLLIEPNLSRRWVDETQWLPKLEAYWLGQNWLDIFTYSTWASAGYAEQVLYNLPPEQVPVQYRNFLPGTEQGINTARLDWFQQLSVPFSLGALRIVPYGNVDLTYYSQDINGDSRGRFYVGGGARATMPFSRLYTDVDSELFNLKGLFHKISFNANYYNAYSDTPYNLLPQLDRLNDDATQQTLRNMRPYYTTYLPNGAGQELLTNPQFNPRWYAIRRLVDTRVDTLDTIQVLQLGINQRWQTKRGYQGMEHTVDWLTFDLSASIFPAANRDNFGNSVSFIEYNAVWAVGDNNGFTSSGWFDPVDWGTRYWNVGGYFNRPDGTNLSVAYRHYDPVGSKMISGAVGYQFSPKYAVNYSAAYDFGTNLGLTNNLNVIRTGTDLTWSVGFSYNAVINNFGINFVVVPNLLATRGLGNTPVSYLSGNNPSGQGVLR